MNKTIVINLGGADKHLSFNMLTIWELAKSLECDPMEAPAKINDVFKENPIECLMHVVYAALISYEKSEGNLKHGIVFKDVCKWVANLNTPDIAQIHNAFAENMQSPEILQQAQADDSDGDAEKKN